jgi:hypothetical protein
MRRPTLQLGLAVTAAAIIAVPTVVHRDVSPAALPPAWEASRQVDAEQASASAANVQRNEAERRAEAKRKREAKRKAEAKRRAQAEERRRAAQRAARARAAQGGSPSANRALGMQMCAARGWSAGQCSDLGRLWQKESGWSQRAHNGSSGAHGIPQALPGSKMASHGSDWATNPRTQIAWGLDYIAGRYGNPSNAWAHSQRTGWY